MSSLDLLPAYLKKYVVVQDYDKYTPVEHATWRYIMRQSRAFFSEHAVDIYVDGLKATGIPIDRIPRISEMDEKLQRFGWGAVGVEGFIPSSVFLDLLARGIMPIACDMRTLEHVGYTPAPDIVHEAAGHAPIVADPAYRDFLNRYAQMAYRALISAEDIKLYEAIRYLSDIKENPDVQKEEIKRAEARLEQVSASMSHLSEAGKVARMAWWTTEYGLVGDLKNPKIYGAGLLSSVAESRNCLSDRVRKIPLTVACVEQTYDITEPQPQLFVAKSMDDLPAVLEELEGTFAFKRGGRFGLEQMRLADSVNSIQFETNVTLSGRLKQFEYSDEFGVESIQLIEEGQLCFAEKELKGYGRDRFPLGMAAPFGRWSRFKDTATYLLTDDDLAAAGVLKNKHCSIQYANGYLVEGEVQGWLREGEKLLLINFKNAKVRRGDHVLVQPEQGSYCLPIGERVESVFAGPADRDAYGDYYVGQASTSPGRKSPYTSEERALFDMFAKTRKLREQPLGREQLQSELGQIAYSLGQADRPNWLLGLEVAELAEQKLGFHKKDAEWLETLYDNVLGNPAAVEADTRILVARGLELLEVPDEG